jgi:predicted acylesterase/phospholipase RssA
MACNVRLAIGGAGTIGAAEVGAYMALEDQVPDFNVDQVAGVSAGSIIACLIALGRTSDEIKKIAINADYSKLINENIFNLLYSSHTLCTNNNVIKFLKEITEERQMKDTNILFQTITTDVVEGKPHVWDSRLYPDMYIWEAVYSSMAIPFIFPPYLNRYVDGGATRNIPVQYLSGPGSIGIAVKESCEKGPITGPINMAERLISLLLTDDDVLIEAWAKVEKIPVVQVPTDNMGFLDRNMTINEKEKLVTSGYVTMTSFLKSPKGKAWIRQMKNQETL